MSDAAIFVQTRAILQTLRTRLDLFESEALAELRRDDLQPFEVEVVLMKFAARLRRMLADELLVGSAIAADILEAAARDSAAQLAAAGTPLLEVDRG